MTDKFRLDEVHSWMFDHALPLWCDAGQDAPGLGFHELVGLDGRPVDPGFKRMRVQARQIYTYCHAATLGWKGPALQAAANGVDFILAHGRLADGGWATKLGPRGEQLDTEPNSYDHAFVIFALGWYYKLTGDCDLLEHIHRTLDFMEGHLRHPTGLGFLTTRTHQKMEQDPNMHFLEAMLVLYEATGESRFAEEARTILTLFAEHIHQPETAVLLEDFDLDWEPPGDPAHRIVEPGHHFEWAWLLWQAKRIVGDDVMPFVPQIFAFADKYGSSPDGLVYDDVFEHGTVLNPTHRTWVQTEAIKGYITMAEFTGADHSARIAQLVDILLDQYLNTAIPGLWTDQPTAVSKATSAPASTFYHIFLAFAELQRWGRASA